jgi:hypothetical protein
MKGDPRFSVIFLTNSRRGSKRSGAHLQHMVLNAGRTLISGYPQGQVHQNASHLKRRGRANSLKLLRRKHGRFKASTKRIFNCHRCLEAYKSIKNSYLGVNTGGQLKRKAVYQ